MSLRNRLFTLLLVSCGALAASVYGLTRILSVGVAAREATAASVGLRAMEALAQRLDGGLAPDGTAIRTVLEDLSGTLEDGTVGVCSPDGHLGAMKAAHARMPRAGGPDGPPPGAPPGGGPPPGPSDEPPGGPGGRPPDEWFNGSPGTPPDERFGGPPEGPGAPELLPLDRSDVSDACRAATGESQTTRVYAPLDVLAISTRRTQTGSVAFALARVPRPQQNGSPANVAFLTLAIATTALLFALTAHGAWVLRVSTASLHSSVEALKGDLRALIPEPRAIELAEVASHLRTLAATLADSQERERTLILDVEEQKRLAGLGRVVAGVAHEVRNPLAGMKLRLDSIALRPLDSRTQVDVERCLREVGRLDRLVRSLLLASRKRALERVSFDVGPMIAERASLAAPLARATDVRIKEEGYATIVGELEGISGAIDNLLRNAIEVSPPGGQVDIITRTEGDAARIEIIDRGPGIPADRVAELFEPFFTTKGSGTGLGLVLARSTIEAHGGTLTYERRGDCTVFTIKLPLVPHDAGHGDRTTS